MPVLGRFVEHFQPSVGDVIVFSPFAALAVLPIGLHESLLLETVEYRVERALLEREHKFAALLDLLDDLVAVHIPRSEDGQHEQRAAALRQFFLDIHIKSSF